MLYVLIIIIILSLLYQNNTSNDAEKIRILTRQTARWAIASKQDKSTLIAVLHANYATGYLWALLDIYTPEEIESVTNIDVKKFREEIIQIQDLSTHRMIKMCPKYSGGDNPYLSKIAKE